MIVTENTMLIQQEDGLLYYKDGDELILASMTDIQKHYKTMQYNLDWLLGCDVTDRGDIIQSLITSETFDKYFWRAEYQQIPENCERIK